MALRGAAAAKVQGVTETSVLGAAEGDDGGSLGHSLGSVGVGTGGRVSGGKGSEGDTVGDVDGAEVVVGTAEVGVGEVGVGEVAGTDVTGDGGAEGVRPGLGGWAE